MNNEPTDPLSICVNANFTADALEELAEYKHAIIGNDVQLKAGPRWWAERLARWSQSDLRAARRIRELVREVDRLREFEWMYKDLCK
jgi:hypothetical protein